MGSTKAPFTKKPYPQMTSLRTPNDGLMQNKPCRYPLHQHAGTRLPVTPRGHPEKSGPARLSSQDPVWAGRLRRVFSLLPQTLAYLAGQFLVCFAEERRDRQIERTAREAIATVGAEGRVGAREPVVGAADALAGLRILVR